MLITIIWESNRTADWAENVIISGGLVEIRIISYSHLKCQKIDNGYDRDSNLNIVIAEREKSGSCLSTVSCNGMLINQIV